MACNFAIESAISSVLSGFSGNFSSFLLVTRHWLQSVLTAADEREDTMTFEDEPIISFDTPGTFSDLVVGEGQGWLWDVPTRELLCHWPDFAPQGWHAQRGELIEWSAQQIKILTP